MGVLLISIALIKDLGQYVNNIICNDAKQNILPPVPW